MCCTSTKRNSDTEDCLMTCSSRSNRGYTCARGTAYNGLMKYLDYKDNLMFRTGTLSWFKVAIFGGVRLIRHPLHVCIPGKESTAIGKVQMVTLHTRMSVLWTIPGKKPLYSYVKASSFTGKSHPSTRVFHASPDHVLQLRKSFHRQHSSVNLHWDHFNLASTMSPLENFLLDLKSYETFNQNSQNSVARNLLSHFFQKPLSEKISFSISSFLKCTPTYSREPPGGDLTD